MSMLLIGILATLVVIGIPAYRAYKKRNKQKSRSASAKARAAAAESRLLKSTRKRVQWTILRFFAQPTITAWGAVFYILISSIGVTYSWALYAQFDEIYIFDFFDTSDFLLSAFQSMKMLIIGVSATLIALFILVYRVYNSGMYHAYTSSSYKQQSKIRREAALLLLITLVAVSVIFCFRPNLSVAPIIMEELKSVLGLDLQQWLLALTRPTITEAPKEALGRLEDCLGLGLYLMSLLILVLLALRFLKLVCLPLRRDKQEFRIKWGGRFLALTLLAGGLFVLPLLSGVNDSKRTLGDKSRPVQVTIRQDAAHPSTHLPVPGRVLLLGATSSFHLFYACGESETGSSCQNGRPVIVPTANLASLEFKPPQRSVQEKPWYWTEFAPVTHFVTSRHDTLDGPGEEKLQRLFRKMNDCFQGYRLQHLIVTGRVDESIFSNEKEREFYGTQIKLARARGRMAARRATKKIPKADRRPPDYSANCWSSTY